MLKKLFFKTNHNATIWVITLKRKLIFFFSAESKQIRRSAFTKAVVQGPFFSSNQLIVFSIVLCYIKTMSPEDTFTTENIFITIALINPLRLVCTLFMPYSVQFGSEALVTVCRIQVRAVCVVFCTAVMFSLGSFWIYFVSHGFLTHLPVIVCHND